MATSSEGNDEFYQAYSSSEIEACLVSLGEVLASPNAQTLLFRRLRSSYPLAGCSPAGPAAVSLDDKSLSAPCTGSIVARRVGNSSKTLLGVFLI